MALSRTNRMLSFYIVAGLAFGSLGAASAQVAPRLAPTTTSEAALAQITITADGKVIQATLRDNATARDLLSRLPMTLRMQRWGEREYYGKPDRALANQGDRQNRFANGDVAYWVPGGSFAIFFDQGTDPSISDLIVIGSITSDLAALRQLGPSVEMRVERAATN